MDILDKILLEWSYRCEKGYPDINNQEDLKIFEKLFELNLKEEVSKKNSAAAAEDFVNSPAANANSITKFKSGKYVNRISSIKLKDLDQIKKMLITHFNLSDEDINLYQAGQGLAARDSVPGFEINTKKFGPVYIAVSTSKKGTGGLAAELALTNGVNNVTQSTGAITVKLTDGKKEVSTEGVAFAKQVGSRRELEGAKADVAFYSGPGEKGTTLRNISVKEGGNTDSKFRWASVNNDKTPFRKSFVNKALYDKSFPVELRRTGHYLDTDKSPRYEMYKRGTDDRIVRVVVEDAPTDANQEYLFGTDQPKTIIVGGAFKDSDFEYDNNTKVLTVKCASIYTDIKQIQGTAVEPTFTVTQHQKQVYGLDFRIVPQEAARFGSKSKSIVIKYADVI